MFVYNLKSVLGILIAFFGGSFRNMLKNPLEAPIIGLPFFIQEMKDKSHKEMPQ